jgi:hypothetical protein
MKHYLTKLILSIALFTTTLSSFADVANPSECIMRSDKEYSEMILGRWQDEEAVNGVVIDDEDGSSIYQETTFYTNNRVKEIIIEKDAAGKIIDHEVSRGNYYIKGGVLYMKANDPSDPSDDEYYEYKLNCISNQKLSFYVSFWGFSFLDELKRF